MIQRRTDKKQMTKGEQVTVRGVVLEKDWDEEYNAVSVVISTVQEEEFVISPNRKGNFLKKHIKELVEATGTLTEDASGVKIITVDAFKKLVIEDETSSTDKNNYQQKKLKPKKGEYNEKRDHRH